MSRLEERKNQNYLRDKYTANQTPNGELVIQAVEFINRRNPREEPYFFPHRLISEEMKMIKENFTKPHDPNLTFRPFMQGKVLGMDIHIRRRR